MITADEARRRAALRRRAHPTKDQAVVAGADNKFATRKPPNGLPTAPDAPKFKTPLSCMLAEHSVRKSTLLLALLALAGVSRPVYASADKAPPSAEEPQTVATAASGKQTQPARALTLSINPVMTQWGLAEFTAEVGVQKYFSVAAILGAGLHSNAAPEGAPYGELGVMGRYYPGGSTDGGWHLGAEIIGSMVKIPPTVLRSGIGAGAFAGYKLKTKLGLRIEGQLGVAHLWARSNSTTATRIMTMHKWQPVVNFNVGWVFSL